LATHYDIVSVDSVSSTQDEAVSHLDATGNATLVVADHQRHGRARQGRSWEEPARGLFSSLAFTMQWPVSESAVITLCTAVALARSVEDNAGVRCDIKWPNDLLVRGDKFAGILVEAEGDTVTIGCGVNLWWPDAPTYAGALFTDDPGPGIAMDISRAWVDGLLEILEAGSRKWPRDAYLQRSWTVGRNVTWEGGSGRAVGVAHSGGLIVATTDGEQIITAGEVHTRQER